MRSDLVFDANDQVINRFQLCQMIAQSARRLSARSGSMSHNINHALALVGGKPVPPESEDKPATPWVKEGFADKFREGLGREMRSTEREWFGMPVKDENCA
jgi:hypothetical protein